MPSLFGRFVIEEIVMFKERVTAKHLAEMIAQRIGAVGLDVIVRRDHAYGWQPNVISAPGDLIGYQRRAEEIAERLRFQFDLQDLTPIDPRPSGLLIMKPSEILTVFRGARYKSLHYHSSRWNYQE